MTDKKVVLITGATGGIGEFLVGAFAAERYRIAIHFKQNEQQSKCLEKIVNSKGGEGLALKADISKSEEVKDLVKKIVSKWGKIDLLINNAGVCVPEIFLRLSEANWDRTIKANLSGTFFCLRETAKMMINDRQGSIINIGSIIGVRGGIGDAGYSAAKSGLIALTKTAARELGKFNIRVNAVLPGCHQTPMLGANSPAILERARKESVLSLTTSGEELAKFVVFLSQMETVSGQVFNWDSRII
ncbi:MAG: SDR family NAD(P)-dependent oxidoreductase [Elusimicrobiota bacterium]